MDLIDRKMKQTDKTDRKSRQIEGESYFTSKINRSVNVKEIMTFHLSNESNNEVARHWGLECKSEKIQNYDQQIS